MSRHAASAAARPTRRIVPRCSFRRRWPPSTVTVDVPQGPGAVELSVGDDLVLLYAPDSVPGGRAYTVVDHQRGRPMAWLLGLGAMVVLAFGRWRGLTSLIGLAVSLDVHTSVAVAGTLASRSRRPGRAN
jgi:hypothetical protein